MRYFPLFIDLDGRRAVVVGGGEEALRKVRLLLKTEVAIDLVADTLSDELARSCDGRPHRLEGKALCARITSTAPPSSMSPMNAMTRRFQPMRAPARIPVNVVDRRRTVDASSSPRSSIAIRSWWRSAPKARRPVLGQGLRARIDAMLPHCPGPSRLNCAKALRGRIAKTVAAGLRAPRLLAEVISSARSATVFLAGDQPAYARELEAALAGDSSPPVGRVSLVGAGPGDPELLTLKAQRKLHEADVIVYDRLVGPAILELARRDAVRIPVGKTPFEPSPKQSEINAILIREAKAGRRVVRLKGGDPYVFGRGGEEQAALEAQGIAGRCRSRHHRGTGLRRLDRPAAHPARPEHAPSRC